MTCDNETFCEEAREERDRLQLEVDRLWAIIDSRPAINAGLPGTYIAWSHSIYEAEAKRADEGLRN